MQPTFHNRGSPSFLYFNTKNFLLLSFPFSLFASSSSVWCSPDGSIVLPYHGRQRANRWRKSNLKRGRTLISGGGGSSPSLLILEKQPSSCRLKDFYRDPRKQIRLTDDRLSLIESRLFVGWSLLSRFPMWMCVYIYIYLMLAFVYHRSVIKIPMIGSSDKYIFMSDSISFFSQDVCVSSSSFRWDEIKGEEGMARRGESSYAIVWLFAR